MATVALRRPNWPAPCASAWSSGLSRLLSKPPSRSEALAQLQRFRILCALRHGPFGVENLNAIAEEILAEAGLLSPAPGGFYRGQPLIITRNDYNLWPLQRRQRHRFARPRMRRRVARVLSFGGRQTAPVPALASAGARDRFRHDGAQKPGIGVCKECCSSCRKTIRRLLTRELLYTGLTRARGASKFGRRNQSFARRSGGGSCGHRACATRFGFRGDRNSPNKRASDSNRTLKTNPERFRECVIVSWAISLRSRVPASDRRPSTRRARGLDARRPTSRLAPDKIASCPWIKRSILQHLRISPPGVNAWASISLAHTTAAIAAIST